MKKKAVFWSVVALYLLTGLCMAGDLITDEQSITTMDEVVVTATKTKETRKDISNSVIIIDSIDIEESGAKTLGELLSNEPGIDLRTRGNYGGANEEIHIRGMQGNATQVYLNGVSINSPSLGTADAGRILLNNIERIEVVKGSGSLLYGSGAMGGTVNIITKQPKRDKMDLKATAGYGTNDSYRLSAEQGMFVFKNIGYYLTANRRETDGFRDNGDLTHNDVSLNMILDNGDPLNISLYGDYINRKFGQPGVQPPAGTADFYIKGQKFYNSDSASLVDHHTDNDSHTILHIKSNPLQWLNINLKGGYTYMKSYNYHRNPMALWPKAAGEGIKTWVTNKVTETEGIIDIKPFNGGKLLLGAEYKDYDNKNEQSDINDTGGTKPGTKTKRNNALFTKAVYAEAQYRPCRYLKALAGIRQENHSIFGHENIYRYGLIINPFKNTTLKFNRGKHFKAPTLNDLFWPDDGWTKGNLDLKPETGWHTDASVEQTLFNDKLFLSFTYFDWDLKNKINWAENKNFPTSIPGWFYWTPSNIDDYKAHGVELGVKAGPFYKFTVSLNYTYLDAKEDRKGFAKRQALYTPDNTFKGNITYWNDKGLTITATARYVDERPYYKGANTGSTPDIILDSYWTADLKIEQKLFDHWIFSLTGSNLFDKGYDTYVMNFQDQSTGVTTSQKYPGAERSVFFSVGYAY